MTKIQLNAVKIEPLSSFFQLHPLGKVSDKVFIINTLICSHKIKNQLGKLTANIKN